jgi:hypothetical protein
MYLPWYETWFMACKVSLDTDLESVLIGKFGKNSVQSSDLNPTGLTQVDTSHIYIRNTTDVYLYGG